jgi:hypothetical protein
VWCFILSHAYKTWLRPTNDGKNFMVQNLQLLFRYVNRNTPIGA